MIKCEFCEDEFRSGKRGDKAYKEHYERFHQEPILNKNGTITVNAVHQIIMITRGNDSWKTLLEKAVKRKDKSSIRGIQQLKAFEKIHQIKFTYRKEGMAFQELK